MRKKKYEKPGIKYERVIESVAQTCVRLPIGNTSQFKTASETSGTPIVCLNSFS